MAPKQEAWSGPIVQAVERIHHIRSEIHQLQLEEAVLRDAVLTALEGIEESEFPLRLGTHDVRVQYRVGRIDESAALTRLSSLGLDHELSRAPEIVSAPALKDLEDAIYRVAMSSKSRQRLVASYHAAIDYRPKVDLVQLKAWKREKRLSDTDFCQCFRDQKAVIRLLSIR